MHEFYCLYVARQDAQSAANLWDLQLVIGDIENPEIYGSVHSAIDFHLYSLNHTVDM